LDFFLLNQYKANAFHDLVIQRSHKQLLLQTTPNMVAWAAEEKGCSVGLAIALLTPNESSANLISLFVHSAYRRQGVGRELLSKLQKDLKTKGCQRVVSDYLIEKETEEQVDRFLQRNGFPPSETALYVFIGDISRMDGLSWFHSFKLPREYSIFQWCQLRAEERAEIECGLEAWYPSALSPFHDEELMDHDHSVGLRYKGKVIGWVIMQRLASNMLLYKTLFVKQEFQRLGRGLAMVIEMIRRTQLVNRIPFGTMAIEPKNEGMLRIVRSRFIPLVIREKVIRRASKQI
jgi:GNAT superfamily N-acetyltransferase